MPSLDSLTDPVGKRPSDYGVDQVDQPLPWELLEVARIAQVLLHDGVLQRKGENFFDAQPFILRAKDVLDVVAVDNYKDGYKTWLNLHLREPSTSDFR